MIANTPTDQRLNVLAVRGTGFPEECLRSDEVESLVSITQANDIFTERVGEGPCHALLLVPHGGLKTPILRRFCSTLEKNRRPDS